MEKDIINLNQDCTHAGKLWNLVKEEQNFTSNLTYTMQLTYFFGKKGSINNNIKESNNCTYGVTERKNNIWWPLIIVTVFDSLWCL